MKWSRPQINKVVYTLVTLASLVLAIAADAKWA
jgi:hypothetical protein